MQYLAFPDQFFHGTRNILNWHVWVDPMLIEQINTVCSKTFKASVHHSLDVIGTAVETALVGEIKAKFRCDLHLVSERFKGTADDGFARVRAVHFSRIEKRYTVAVCRTDDLNGVVDGDGRAIVCREIHAAESQLRYFQLSKLSRLHVFFLTPRLSRSARLPVA
jgi:hypothetical protein